MESWAHQAAILSLFIAAPLLALLFGFRRRFYFYDRLIFSMHSLAFQSLLLDVALVSGGWVTVAWLLLLLAPFHLFVQMRGTYDTGIVDTLLRMTILFVGSFFGFAVLMAGLVLIGLAAES